MTDDIVGMCKGNNYNGKDEEELRHVNDDLDDHMNVVTCASENSEEIQESEPHGNSSESI